MRYWHIDPDRWEALSPDARLRMYKLWQIENARQAKEASERDRR